jgi:hypothetical protein
VFTSKPPRRHKLSKTSIRRARIAGRVLAIGVKLYLAIHGPLMS